MEQRETKLHVMAVGAHIHDAEVMAGAVLLKYVFSGHSISIVHATPGDKGNPRIPSEEYEKIKVDEAERSGRVLGAKVIHLPYKDAELPLNHEARTALTNILRELKPDIILTHWRGSFHPDHYKTHCLVMDAVSLAADPSFSKDKPPHRVRWVYFSENWEDMTGYSPEIHVDVSEVYNVWWGAMMEHGLFRGGISKFAYKEYYDSLSAMRGARIGVPRAVTLMSSEFCRNKDRRELPALDG